MADRCSLHKNKIVEFTAYMMRRGYSSERTKGGYEVRRFVNKALSGPARTVVVFEKERAREHLSMQDKDWELFRDFMREQRG